MYIIIHRPHAALKIETIYYGPFLNYEEAETFLETLPAIGDVYFGEYAEVGCKYIQCLTPPIV